MAKKEQAPQLEKLLYRRQEAAFVLGLSIGSIDAMIADERLRTRKFGRAVLIPAADVQKVADQIILCDMPQGVSSTGPRLVG